MLKETSPRTYHASVDVHLLPSWQAHNPQFFHHSPLPPTKVEANSTDDKSSISSTKEQQWVSDMTSRRVLPENGRYLIVLWQTPQVGRLHLQQIVNGGLTNANHCGNLSMLCHQESWEEWEVYDSGRPVVPSMFVVDWFQSDAAQTKVFRKSKESTCAPSLISHLFFSFRSINRNTKNHNPQYL